MYQGSSHGINSGKVQIVDRLTQYENEHDPTECIIRWTKVTSVCVDMERLRRDVKSMAFCSRDFYSQPQDKDGGHSDHVTRLLCAQIYDSPQIFVKS